MKIDMGHKGPLGMDVTIRNGVLYLGGSNHWLEWAHHFTPGAAWRERRWARQVVQLIDNTDVMIHTIAGHSVGGTVACLVSEEIPSISLITYGAKRPPRGKLPPHGRITYGKHYAIKGDIVPSLPPWRKSLPLIELDYGKLNPVEAHGPRSYYEQMEKDGIRR